MYMIRHQMPFFYLAPLLPGERSEYFPQIPSKPLIKRLSASLEYKEDDAVFVLSFGVT